MGGDSAGGSNLSGGRPEVGEGEAEGMKCVLEPRGRGNQGYQGQKTEVTGLWESCFPHSC